MRATIKEKEERQEETKPVRRARRRVLQVLNFFLILVVTK